MGSLLVIGTALILSAALLSVFALQPHGGGIPRDRRRPFEEESTSQLSRFAGSAVRFVEGLLTHYPIRLYRRELLELAGLKLSQADYIILVGSGTLVLGLMCMLLGGVGLALLIAILTPFAAHVLVTVLINQRRTKFNAQLSDTLQLLTGGLRAGHSILRAIDAAAAEADSPTSEEMHRIVTETSLGKDLLHSLNDTSTRMASEDFMWIAQAIQINREVGGDLAEVLDQVSGTIRERTEIKGQIKALAAEGKMSAYILMALPIGIVTLLSVVNPAYIGVLFTEPLGWLLIGVSIVLMIIGALWLRKIIDLKF
ncbi:type II secretion system protein F [Arthrobacter crystallopoietes]|nr:type II secretion system protein F [Arthrobacter crystallopoietes]